MADVLTTIRSDLRCVRILTSHWLFTHYVVAVGKQLQKTRYIDSLLGLAAQDNRCTHAFVAS